MAPRSQRERRTHRLVAAPPRHELGSDADEVVAVDRHMPARYPLRAREVRREVDVTAVRDEESTDVPEARLRFAHRHPSRVSPLERCRTDVAVREDVAD